MKRGVASQSLLALVSRVGEVSDVTYVCSCSVVQVVGRARETQT